MRQPAASTLAIALSSLALAGCSGANVATAPATPSHQAVRQVPTQLPRMVRPLHYAISVVPDAPNLRFAATARIDVEVLKPTDSITLSAAELDFASATLSATGGAPLLASRIAADAEKQTATIHFPDRLTPGRYSLSINYSGKINTQASGLFALDYDSSAGKKRALYTQFAPADGRRFMPSWDEPIFRTPYDLKVTVPAGQTAVSNMPQAGREERPDGSHVVTFETTPAMSSYLLFLGVGQFDRIATSAAGTEVGIVAKAGDAEKGRFALAESAKVVPWFTDYFGTAYPLPKLDNIAGPGSSQSFAAMENWGAIFTFDNYLLVDPAITTEAQRQAIALVLTHEISHQWFGNLVTMAWWDDIWLNESFASWITTKALDKLHPEWEPTLGRIATRERAMNLDSIASTHPVIQEVKTVEEMNQIFDVITYQKGEAVLTMLEDYVGEAPWRAGVRDYIATYRLQNTVTDDLWMKVESVAAQPVRAIAGDFTRQPGIPLIHVDRATCSGGRTSVTLRQAEFSRDRPDKAALSWRVPIIAAVVDSEAERMLMEGGAATLDLPGCGTTIVNRGQAGYYRTLYAPALLDRLTSDYARLEPIDQIGLLADNWALGLAGYQSASEALDLIDAIPANANPQLWGRSATILAQVRRMYDGDPARQALVSRYASTRLAPVLARIGWRASSAEAAPVSILRANLIQTLGSLGDPGVAAEARRRFDAGDPSATSGPLRAAILAAVSANVDAAGWDRLRQQAREETSPQVRLGLYQLLAAAHDPTLARRSLELALTEEPGATNSAAIIAGVAAEHPDLAYDFAIANQARVDALVDILGRAQFIPGLGSGSSDPAMIAKLNAFAERNATARRPADIAIAAVEDRVKVRQTRLPDITRWLEARLQ